MLKKDKNDFWSYFFLFIFPFDNLLKTYNNGM